MAINTDTNENQFYTTKLLMRISLMFQAYAVNCCSKQFLIRINS